MKNIFAIVLTVSAVNYSAVLPANAVPPNAADSKLGNPVPAPSLVPIAATAINGLIQAESLQQKLADDRATIEKQLAADKAAEQRVTLKEPIENLATAPESIELPEIETPDSPD